MRPFDLTEVEAYSTWKTLGNCDPAAFAAALGQHGIPLRVDAHEALQEMSDWSGVWYGTDLRSILPLLQGRRLTVEVRLGSKPKVIAELAIKHGPKKRIASVRAAADHYDILQRLCEAIKLNARIEIPYYGDSLGCVCDRIGRSLLVERRDAVNRASIWNSQSGRCHKCGKATQKYEVHHKVPLSQGGSNELSNLVGLCQVCHREYTEMLKDSACESYKGFVSQMSPRLANLFALDVRKPKPWNHGLGTDGGDVQCIDIVGCRRNALFSAERLPVFGPADAEMPFDWHAPLSSCDYYWLDAGDPPSGDVAVLYQGPNLYPWRCVERIFQIGIANPEHVRFCLRASRALEGWKLKDVFDRIELAMRLVDPKAYAQLEDDPFGDYEDFVHGMSKGAFNSVIGLWNRVARYSYKVRRSGCVDDMHRVDIISSSLGAEAGIADLLAATRVIGCDSVFPIGLMALQLECLAVYDMRRQTQHIGLNFLGVKVDGIFFEWSRYPEEREKQKDGIRAMLAMRHPHGGPVYHMQPLKCDDDTKEPRYGLVPRCQQRLLEGPAPKVGLPPRLRVLREADVPAAIDKIRQRQPLTQLAKQRRLPPQVMELISWGADMPLDDTPTDLLGQIATLVVRNEGGGLYGPAGTGKTLAIQRINEIWRRERPGDTIVNTAPTHVAARLMPNGQTLARVLADRKYGKVRNTVFIVDEIGMVPLSTMKRLGEWQLVGAKFVLLGDFEGQFEPVADAWRREDMHNADLYRQLTRSLKVKLSTNRRAAGDPGHFAFYTGLYPFVKQPDTLGDCVRQATERYPWDGEVAPDTRVFVVSHRLRRIVNGVMNLRFVRPLPGAVLVQSAGDVFGTLNQPQAMYLVPEMLLLGVTRKSARIVNGVLYRVLAVDQTTVTVQMTEDYRVDRACIDATTARGEKALRRADRLEAVLVLSHEDASTCLRLTHATTYRSAQGVTIRDRPVLLLDAHHLYFDTRTLIVGLSRVAVGSQLAVATKQQQSAAFGCCGNDESNANAPFWLSAFYALDDGDEVQMLGDASDTDSDSDEEDL
jgi:5-methylcytosine-specific restriction endonuclease McrA